MVIFFKHPLARRQLLEKGYVATFRTRRRRSGQDWAVDERRRRIAEVWISDPITIRPTVESLKRYVKYSGFPSVMSWLSAIKKLHKRVPRVGYLYFVLKKPISEEALSAVRGLLKAPPPPVAPKWIEVRSYTVVYYPAEAPPVRVTVNADGVTATFTQTMLTRAMRIPETKVAMGKYVIKPTVIRLPPRPRFFMGDYVETDDKAYRLAYAYARCVEGRFTPWKWVVEETDKKTGETRTVEMTEREWSLLRRKLGAPPYMSFWTWEIPRLTLPVEKYKPLGWEHG